MVCMISDYIENGAGRHNEFIALLDNPEEAVRALHELLSRSGKQVVQITVIPGAHTMAQLEYIAENGLEPGEVAETWIFEGAHVWTARKTKRFS